MIIDYTQFSAYQKCPRYWYERYVKGWVREWTGQSDSALTLGGMVHKALEYYQMGRDHSITEDIVVEYNPTPDTVVLARELVNGYVRAYPRACDWELVGVEEPLTYQLSKEITALAKVDAFFYVPETATMPNGDGGTIHLEPGYWVQEYKTKSASVDRNKYAMGWEVNKQADFQIMCLQSHINSGTLRDVQYPQVRGVLINVLEKPRGQRPQRTCKGCKNKLEFASYLRTEGGDYACPLCGEEQKLKPLTDSNAACNYYRLAVTRTAGQLVEAEFDIVRAGFEMNLIAYEEKKPPSNYSSCVHSVFGACEYFDAHTYMVPIENLGTFVKRDTKKYMEKEGETNGESI